MPASTDIAWREVEIIEVTTDKRGGWWVTLLEENSRGRFAELKCRCAKARYQRIRAYAAGRGFAFDLSQPSVIGMGALVDLEREDAGWKLTRVKEALAADGPYSRWRAHEREDYRRTRRMREIREPRALTVGALREDNVDLLMRGKRCLVIAPEGAKGLSDIKSVLARHGVAPDRFVVSYAKLQASPEAVAAGIKKALQNAKDDVGVAVVARGGGPSVDMAAFDSSVVAQAFASSPIPVICAVGHEEDVHLADQAATYSAGSPSAAAYCLAPILDAPADAEHVVSGTPLSTDDAATDEDVTREMPRPRVPRHDTGPRGFGGGGGASANSAFDSPPVVAPEYGTGTGASTNGYGAVPRAPRTWPRRVLKWAVFAAVACLLFVGVLRPVGRWFSSLGQGSSTASSAGSEPRMIRSVSTNIVCALTPEFVRCDIKEAHDVPPVPTRCTGARTWGHVYVVTAKGTQAQCPQQLRLATSMTTSELPYGESVTVGDVTCSDARTGMTCKVGSHGVTLSKARSATW